MDQAPTVSEEAKKPYLHLRPTKRIVGVGGEADRPVAKIYGNEKAIRRLIGDLQRALEAGEGMAIESTLYFEVDGRPFDLWLMRCTDPGQMGEAREPERPDYSRFT